MDNDDGERRRRPADEKERHGPDKTDCEERHSCQDRSLHRGVGLDRMIGQDSVAR
jgi:hypothetical protein